MYENNVRSLIYIMMMFVVASCSKRDIEHGQKSFFSKDSGSDSFEDDTGTGIGNDGIDSATPVEKEPPNPEVKEAVVQHSAPVVRSCTRMDAGEGANPSLFTVSDKWFAFFQEGGEYSSPLKVRQSDVFPVNFGEAVTLLHGARKVDLIQDGATLKALASRQFYAVLMSSDDGLDWQELGNIAPDEPTYNCEGFPPAKFFRTSGTVEHIVMGSDYNTGIFGCTKRIFVGNMQGDTWSVPKQVGKGDAVFAYEGRNQLTIVSTFSVYASLDDGMRFTELKGGDTTATQLEGTGATVTGQRLILAQTYNWANEYAITIVISEDEGATWTKRTVLQKSGNLYLTPIIEADEALVAVAWIAADAVWIMYSPDRGETWSSPGQFSNPTELSGIRNISLAVSSNSIAVMFQGDGVHFCIGQAE